ncbi:MAG: HAD family phosphatase [Rhodothermales bacterium]|nr:HAD family phosphatase [Rhodothermales bacterium]
MSHRTAVIFDLDGTLVQTERLKAYSYARAAVAISEATVNEEEIIEAFKDVVGRSRQEVGEMLMRRFGLESGAHKLAVETGATSPLDAYLTVRLRIYEEMLADPLMIRNNIWPHTMALLRHVIKKGCAIGLATMSHRQQVDRVLDVLDIADCFDAIATHEDVRVTKPDPEIYLLVAEQLDRRPEECLVIEDSVAGVEAGLAAGMAVVAVSTPFTKDRLNKAGLLPAERLIHDPKLLAGVVDILLQEPRRIPIDH